MKVLFFIKKAPLIIAIVYLLFLALYLTNWSFRARINILGDGYLNYTSYAPVKASDFPINYNGQFASKLVYAHGVYVGYLDTYGSFAPVNTRLDFHREADTLYLNILIAAVSIIIIMLYVIMYIRKCL